MSLDSDVALLGTGVAPLIAAARLISEGKTVLILNPDWDFFLEDSELSLDPLPVADLTAERVSGTDPERALTELRPEFPGAIEFWSSRLETTQGFHDPLAPHVRQRGRLWTSRISNWESLEEKYVEFADHGLNSEIIEGIRARRRFPGESLSSESDRFIYIPRSCDVDVSRYRNGLVEYVRERLGTQRALCSVSQVEPIPEGVRFHAQGKPWTARLSHGLIVFWTPRLSSWVLNQAKRMEIAPLLPKGVRIWEQWSLISPHAVDPASIGAFSGAFGEMIAWAEAEGPPEAALRRLAVLRRGPLIPLSSDWSPFESECWASAESLQDLAELCYGFMKWERLSIRSMRPRAIFEWNEPKAWSLSRTGPWIRVQPGCDGPIVDVVHLARKACEGVESK